jgi:predicted Zn-dependent peptidase
MTPDDAKKLKDEIMAALVASRKSEDKDEELRYRFAELFRSTNEGTLEAIENIGDADYYGRTLCPSKEYLRAIMWYLTMLEVGVDIPAEIRKRFGVEDGK